MNGLWSSRSHSFMTFLLNLLKSNFHIFFQSGSYVIFLKFYFPVPSNKWVALCAKSQLVWENSEESTCWVTAVLYWEGLDDDIERPGRGVQQEHTRFCVDRNYRISTQEVIRNTLGSSSIYLKAWGSYLPSCLKTHCWSFFWGWSYTYPLLSYILISTSLKEGSCSS